MFKAFLNGLPQVVVGSYREGRWIWHVIAAIATYALVFSGADWNYFLATRDISHYGIGAALLGFFVPIVVPVALYIYGEIRGRTSLRLAGAALAQAAIAAWLISSFYKVFTGRMQPEFYTYTSTVDSSHAFQFGILRHGIFWGWPSSHVTVAYASCIALMLLFPRNRAIWVLTPLYLLYVTLGVSVSIHWLSDVVAAVLIGTTIGIAAVHRHRGAIQQ